MLARLLVLATVFVAFGALSTIALLDVGYWGILAPHFQSWGAAQVFADLVILATLSCVWIVIDARPRGIASWPFVAVTLVAGAFGPLSYLIARELRRIHNGAKYFHHPQPQQNKPTRNPHPNPSTIPQNPAPLSSNQP